MSSGGGRDPAEHLVTDRRRPVANGAADQGWAVSDTYWQHSVQGVGDGVGGSAEVGLPGRATMGDLIGRELGQYQLREMIKRGGMATVYKAFQPSLERWVAVKVLSHPGDPTFVSRFRLEARSIARLQHPNIVPIHDYGEADGQPYLVVALVEDGRSLVDLVGTPVAPARALELVALLLAGLGYAHERGLVHRDVKPANILLPTPNWPMLADFGIAKLLLGGGSGLTQTGLVVGTPAYMSPEQAFGLSVDRRTDLYAAGLVLYELLTGRVPFEADTPAAALMKQAYEPPPPPRALNPELSVQVERILLKALAKDPAGRYQDAEEMAGAIRAAMEELPARITPVAEVPVAGAPATVGPGEEAPAGQPDVEQPVDDAFAGAYAAGVAAYTAGRWDEAVRRLGSLAETDPGYEDVEALLESAHAALARQGRSPHPSAAGADRPGPGVADETAPATRPPGAAAGAAGAVALARSAGGQPAGAPVRTPPPGSAAATPPPPGHPGTAAPGRDQADPGRAGQPPPAPGAAARQQSDSATKVGKQPSRLSGWLLPGAAAVLGVIGLVALGLWLSRDGGATPAPTTVASQTPTTAPAAPAVKPQAWAAVAAQAPLALESSGTAAFKGQVWVAGGFDDKRKGRSDVLVYDPARKQWRKGPALPQALTHAALVSTGKELLLVGGYRGSTLEPITTVRRLDPTTNTWVRGPSLPVAVGAGAAAWDGKRVVFGGGVTADGKPSAAVYVLDGSSWRRIGALTKAREHLAAASDGKGTTFFLAGEVNDSNGKAALADVDVVKGATVRKLGTVGTPRGSVAGFFSPADGACVAGGRDGSDRLYADVECVDAAGTRKSLPSLPTPRHGLGAAVVGGKVFALLGAAPENVKLGEVLPLEP